jgi:hypothetical protein
VTVSAAIADDGAATSLVRGTTACSLLVAFLSSSEFDNTTVQQSRQSFLGHLPVHKAQNKLVAVSLQLGSRTDLSYDMHRE